MKDKKLDIKEKIKLAGEVKELNVETVLFRLKRFFIWLQISLSYSRRVQIYRDLTSHIRSTDLDDALTALQKEAEALGSIELLMYEEIQIGLRQQKTFYSKVSEWVPRDEALQIYIANQGRDGSSDALPDAIDAARNICEKKSELFSMYVGKLAYPFVMLIITFCMFYGFKVYGYDFLTDIRDFDEWPIEAQSKYNSMAFIADNIFYIAGVSILAIYGVVRFMRRGEGALRSAVNKLPPFSIYQCVISYTVLMSLASLTRSGVQLAESLRLISSSLDGWAKSELEQMIERLERPNNLPEGVTLTEYAFNSALFTKLVRVKVGSYARREDFVENLDYLNSVLMHSVKSESTKGAAILGALLIFGVMGFIVQVAFIFFTALMGNSNPFG